MDRILLEVYKTNNKIANLNNEIDNFSCNTIALQETMCIALQVANMGLSLQKPSLMAHLVLREIPI